jgi:glycosyltransferase involved in cell wall biosynthesis
MSASLVHPAEIEFKLANVWRQKGKWERALAGYQQAIRLQPDYAPAHLELGNLMLEQGWVEGAITVFSRALELNHQDEGLRSKLSKLLHKEEETRVAFSPPLKQREPQDKYGRHILFYTDCAGINGAEQINHELMCGLATSGYRVTCAQSQAWHYLIQAREQAGIRHAWLAKDNIYDTTKPSRALNDAAEPYDLLSAAKPDFIIFGDGCPLSSFMAKQVAKQLGIPYLVIVHCVTPAWAKKFAPWLQRLSALYHQAQAVIAVSQENLGLLHDLFRLPPPQGRVIHNGRPAAYFAPPDPAARQHLRQQLGIPSEAVVCFTAARMDFVKGYHHQIAAIKQLAQSSIWPRLYFVWAGTGSIESRLRAMTIKLSVNEHVKFLGERPDVAALLDAADMFILPSHFEGMPLSIMEAMAKGLPVMATAVSGIPEELGETGKLLPDPNLDAQATARELAATIQAWTTEAQLRQRIGRECKRRAEEKFRAERMLEDYLKIVTPAMALR